MSHRLSMPFGLALDPDSAISSKAIGERRNQAGLGENRPRNEEGSPRWSRLQGRWIRPKITGPPKAAVSYGGGVRGANSSTPTLPLNFARSVGLKRR
jgi:hypothetical protein